MKLLITSSVEKSIVEAAKTATELGTGLEISRFPHLEKIDDDFNSIITEMKDGISDFDGIVTLHALFSGLNPGVSDKALKEVVNKRYQQSFEAAMAVGAKHVNFHSGHKGMHHRVSIEKNCQTSIKFWKEYIKQFEDNGVVAVLENVLDFDYEHIKTIVDEVNSPFLKYVWIQDTQIFVRQFLLKIGLKRTATACSTCIYTTISKQMTTTTA